MQVLRASSRVPRDTCRPARSNLRITRFEFPSFAGWTGRAGAGIRPRQDPAPCPPACIEGDSPNGARRAHNLFRHQRIPAGDSLSFTSKLHGGLTVIAWMARGYIYVKSQISPQITAMIISSSAERTARGETPAARTRDPILSLPAAGSIREAPLCLQFAP